MDIVKSFKLQHSMIEITPDQYAEMVHFLATRVRLPKILPYEPTPEQQEAIRKEWALPPKETKE